MMPQSSNVDVKGKFGVSAHIYPERIENNIQLFACICLVALVMMVIFGVVACFLASSSPWLSFFCVVVVISCFAFMVFCIIKRISSTKEEPHHNPSSISDEEKAIQAAEEFSKQIQRDLERKEELEILRMKQELAGGKREGVTSRA